MTWNRCDVCGQFIALRKFGQGAIRRLIYPDSHYTTETYETLCVKHANINNNRKVTNG